MKKLLILFFVLSFVGLNAQQVVQPDEFYIAIQGEVSDTLSYNDDTTAVFLYKTVFLPDRPKFDYFIQVEIDSAGSGDYIDIFLRGSLNGKNFSNLDTMKWYQSTSDTNFSFSSSSSVYWRYLQLYFYSDSTSADLQIPKIGTPLRFRIVDE